MTRTLTAALALCVLAPAFAVAQEADLTSPALRRTVTVASDVVRIGDLVRNAGAAANIPVFRSPDLGQVGTVPVASVLDALRPYGLTEIEGRGLTEISVTRASREFTPKDIEHRIAAIFAGRHNLGSEQNLVLTFDRDMKSIEAEPTVGDLEMERAAYDPTTTRFDVSFGIEDSATGRRTRLRYTGTLVDTVEAVIVQRPLTRGEIIGASDIALVRRPKATVGPDTVARVERVVGLATRQAVEAGQPVRLAQLMKPEIVHRDDAVTITFEMPGLTLNLRGKALDAGSNGEVINVLNAQSKRTVQGIVSGPGHVVLVSNPAQTLALDSQPTGSIQRAVAQRSAE